MAVEFNMNEALATTFELVNKKLRQSFEQEFALFNQFQKVEKTRTNQRGYRTAIYTSPNASINWRGESGALPGGGTSKTKEMRTFYVRAAIARRLSGDVLDLDDQDSLLKSLTDGLDMDYNTLKKEINQQMFGDGTGLKGVVGSVAGAVVTFTRPYGATQVLEGGNYQFYDPATGTVRSATISIVAGGGVNKSGLQATFTANIPGGVIAGDHMAWADSYLRSITGLKKLIADDSLDFQGVSRGDVPSLKSPNLDALSGRLSLSKIDQQELQVILRAGRMDGANNHVYIVPATQLQAYRELGRNYQMYTSGQSWDGGNGGINNQTVNGRRMWFDSDCDEDRFYLVDFSGFYICELAKFGVIGHDGQRLRMIPNFTSGDGSHLDSNIYYVGTKFDVGLYEPQKQSVIYGLDTGGLVNPHFN